MRTLLACGCLAAARFVPFLAFFMSLIGSFLTIAVSVILPVSVHLKIFQVCDFLTSSKSLHHHPATRELAPLHCRGFRSPSACP